MEFRQREFGDGGVIKARRGPRQPTFRQRALLLSPRSGELKLGALRERVNCRPNSQDQDRARERYRYRYRGFISIRRFLERRWNPRERDAASRGALLFSLHAPTMSHRNWPMNLRERDGREENIGR